MISYDDLCAALDRYSAQRAHGGAAPAHATATPAVVATPVAHATAPDEAHAHAEVDADYGTEEHTSISTALPPDEDASEVELGDVLSDEESAR